jgi:hypothetical protein
MLDRRLTGRQGALTNTSSDGEHEPTEPTEAGSRHVPVV